MKPTAIPCGCPSQWWLRWERAPCSLMREETQFEDHESLASYGEKQRS
jgi:hypothetical protein